VRIFQVDAFTSTRFGGNPATVVLDADGQTDAVMASVAREFSHAEVAFVAAATAPDHDLRVRFFNARKEAPFVGHATLAAHAVLLALGRRGLGVVRQASGTGVIEVQATAAVATAAVATASDADSPLIEFRQTAPELSNPLPLKTTLRVAEALRLPATSLDEMMPARIARKGSSRLLVPVGNARALEGLAPNFDTLLELGVELGTEGFFVFAVNGAKRAAAGTQGMTTESRMFCPALGINEDPASGNAHVMLASYLVEMGQIGMQQSGFLGLQGRHMRRPSQIHVRLERDRSTLVAAHIGGHAVLVSEGTLSA
jgi:PhzF family phenazine biosynthesis protein